SDATPKPGECCDGRAGVALILDLQLFDALQDVLLDAVSPVVMGGGHAAVSSRGVPASSAKIVRSVRRKRLSARGVLMSSVPERPRISRPAQAAGLASRTSSAPRVRRRR